MRFTRAIGARVYHSRMSSDVRLLQFSDTHLFASPQGQLRGVQTLSSMQRVLQSATGSQQQYDALLCTGDVVNDETDGYALFARALGGIGTPVFCVPGNHDDPVRMRAALSQRPFQVGGYADLGAWRLVLVDSCVPGQPAGRVSDQELAALDAALAGSDRFAMVCVHHHPVQMSSRWLDSVGIENATDFLQVIDAHSNVRALTWGHVHQSFDQRRRGVRLLATPSTCIQFLPGSEDFAVDARPPAYRRTTLRADGSLDSELVWLDTAGSALRAFAS